MVMVDSSVWIDYFNGVTTWQTEILDRMLQRIPVLTGDIIVTEVLQGFRRDRDFRQAREILALLECKSMWGCAMAEHSAMHYRILRKKGITVRKTVDVVIGTFCLLANLPLLHDDRDFEPMTQHLGLLTIERGWR